MLGLCEEQKEVRVAETERAEESMEEKRFEIWVQPIVNLCKDLAFFFRSDGKVLAD